MAGDVQYKISIDWGNAKRALDDLSKKINEVDQDFQNFSKKLVTGAAAIGAALVAAGVSAGRFADEMGDIAAANETTVDSVIALAQALQIAGGRSENAGRFFNEFTKTISEANAGNAKTIETFGRLGITMSDLGRLSRDELQGRVLRSLQDIRDPIERNTVAMQMFGKAAMGVDFRGFNSLLEEQKTRYAEYREAIDTAGAALGRLEGLFNDIKVAAAVAFEPFFRAIKALKIDTEDLITTFKVLVSILAAMVGPAILAGLAKLVVAFKTFNDVVGKNKLLSIVSILLSAGGAAAAWLGLNKEVETSTANVNKELEGIGTNTENNRRQQDGYNQMVKKEIDSLTKARQELDKQTAAIRNKVDLETRSLTLSETQRRIAQETAAIETSTADQLLRLQDEFNKLTAERQSAQRQLYETERAAIIANGEAAKKDITARIDAFYKLKGAIEDTTTGLSILGKAEEEVFRLRQQLRPVSEEAQIRQNSEINISLERRRVLLDALRKSGQSVNLYEMGEGLLSNTSNLARAVDTAINKFRQLEGVTDMSPEAFEQLKKSLEAQLTAIDQANMAIADQQRQTREAQRSFAYGWEEAFIKYRDAATNSAQQARDVFQAATKGMEDMIVNFVKTGKLNFRDFLNMIAEMILRSQIQRLIAQMFGGGMGGGAGPGIFSSLGSFFSNLFAGFFANGGMIPPGKVGVVGEAGPELVTGPAQITPMAAAGGGTYITYNINAVDTQSFQQALARDPEFLFAVTEKGRRSLPTSRR